MLLMKEEMKTDRINILGLQIEQISFEQAIERVKTLGLNHIPSFICFANVHMTIEAHNDPVFARKVNSATYIFADGKPIAKACKALYDVKQERIAGMDFMPRLLEAADTENFRVFLYGSTTEVLTALEKKITASYGNIQVVGAISPPFRPLSHSEQDEFIRQMNLAAPHAVFVSLGCPKQEKWMYDHHLKIRAVLLGVGGAFRVVAGLQRRAPVWMQKAHLEWLYRLMQEPRRLFNRYLETNTIFSWLIFKKLLKKKFDE
jgi:N-acetylglucosaminyldiphosphoundecaprenol N-acetyl-beta-D-mannosaminyltransferase